MLAGVAQREAWVKSLISNVFRRESEVDSGGAAWAVANGGISGNDEGVLDASRSGRDRLALGASQVTMASSSAEMSSMRSATTWVTSPSRCSRPVTFRQRPEITARRNCRKVFAQTTMFAVPVSSSRVRNTTPFAVPGRWRQVTSPATATRTPAGGIVRSAAVRQCGGLGQTGGTSGMGRTPALQMAGREQT